MRNRNDTHLRYVVADRWCYRDSWTHSGDVHPAVFVLAYVLPPTWFPGRVRLGTGCQLGPRLRQDTVRDFFFLQRVTVY